MPTVAALVLSLLTISVAGNLQSALGQEEVCRINLAIVLDRSGSIAKDAPGTPQNWDDIKTFLRNLVGTLTIGENDAYVGLVTFSEYGQVQFTFGNKTKGEMDLYLSTLFYDYTNGGRTNTYDGLRLANEYLFTPEMTERGVANLILLLTDGKATPQLNSGLSGIVNDIKARGIRVIGVGITAAINEAELKSIVTNDQRDYFTIQRFSELEGLLTNISKAVCRVLDPPECPVISQEYRCDICQPTCENPNPVCNTTSCVEDCFCPRERPVLIDGVRCGRLEECVIEPCRIDLALVVDESGSIARDSINNGGPDYWPTMRTFIINVINSLDIGFFETRVGLVLFANSARVIFDFDDITDKADIESAILDIECKCYDGGNTNTSGALKLYREELQIALKGDRPDVPNVVLLVTDGVDNIGQDSLLAEANLIKSNSRLIAVAVSNLTNEARLQQIVSDGSSYFKVGEFEQLTEILDNLIDQTCQQQPCPPPVDPELAISFHAYSIVERVPVSRNRNMTFELTQINMGNHYNTETGIFTCPCKGVYYFQHVFNGISASLSTAIMMDEEIISPLAFISAHGAMSTSAVVMCNAGQSVYVQVQMVEPDSVMAIGTQDGKSLRSFNGFILFPLA